MAQLVVRQPRLVDLRMENLNKIFKFHAHFHLLQLMFGDSCVDTHTAHTLTDSHTHSLSMLLAAKAARGNRRHAPNFSN